MIQVKHDDSLVFNKRNQLFPNMQIYNRLKNNGGRVGKGISAQASHRTVREALTSYGSYYPVAMTLPIVD